MSIATGVKMRAIVVGAGIGGLTATLTLRRAGVEVEVFEQAPELREVGAGLTMAPNASRILHRLGLEPEMRATGVRLDAITCRRYDDGRVLTRYVLGDEVEKLYGVPSYYFYRPELLDILSAPVPSEIIHLDHRLVGINQYKDRVEARFANGAIADADFIVGADGIHSVVRETLFGPDSPRFSGRVAYRGLVSADRLKQPMPMELLSWWGPIRHTISYPVGRGARFLNIVASAPAHEWRIESWSARGEVEELLAEYAEWNIELRETFSRIDFLFKWATYDRDPLEHWSKGRVTLLGDAAHAMLASMGQGAAQAIEDAAVLAKCVERADSARVIDALQVYEQFRKPRTTRIQLGSRAIGGIYQLADGEEQRKRDANFESAMARLYPGPQNSWLWGYDAEVEFERSQ
jgi:2-polyprenyl-6-methoxyphenol hydroxylase-like FAD-dependent oxidoreductase